jgi:hypothetical protein
MANPVQCPICSAPIPEGKLFVCPDCWWEIPTADRRMLSHMHRSGQDTTSKVASVVRKLKESHG